jgi:hypothetical protein
MARKNFSSEFSGSVIFRGSALFDQWRFLVVPWLS